MNKTLVYLFMSKGFCVEVETALGFLLHVGHHIGRAVQTVCPGSTNFDLGWVWFAFNLLILIDPALLIDGLEVIMLKLVS